jgi:hypothetical protein
MAPRRFEVAVGSEREAKVRIAERPHVVVDALCRMFGQRLPTVSHVGASYLDALEQRSLIGNIDVVLGIHRA